MAEQGCKLFVYGVDQNLDNGEIQVGSFNSYLVNIGLGFKYDMVIIYAG